MVTGIVLAGGKSSRLAMNKMMLDFLHKPMIIQTIESIKPFVDKLVIVTGRYHKEIVKILDGYDVIYNQEYEKGMFSSILKGVKEAEGNFLILPGDCPFVKKTTFDKLLNCDSFKIRVPIYQGKNGHPLLFSYSLKEQLLKEDLSSNLKAFRDKIGYEQVEVNDPNILNDVDTIEEYKRLKIEKENEEHGS